jgi:hypothetical protein
LYVRTNGGILDDLACCPTDALIFCNACKEHGCTCSNVSAKGAILQRSKTQEKQLQSNAQVPLDKQFHRLSQTHWLRSVPIGRAYVSYFVLGTLPTQPKIHRH